MSKINHETLPIHQQDKLAVHKIISTWKLEHRPLEIKGLTIAILENPKSQRYWHTVLAILSLEATPVLLHDQVFAYHQYDHHLKWQGMATYSSLAIKGCEENICKANLEQSIIFFTSGSEGPRRPIVHSLTTLIRSAHLTNSFYNINDNDIYPLTLPMNHVGGFLIPIRNTLRHEKTIFIEDEKFLPFIQRLRPTILSIVPAHLSAIFTLKSHRFRALIVGGAPTSKSDIAKAKEISLPLSLSYGLTETAAQVAATNPSDFNHSSMTILPGRSLKIENGQIVIKSGPLMSGQFYNNQFIPHKGDYKTNDLGEIDQEGLVVEGRADQIFISGGENISPKEIENLIEKYWPHSSPKILAVDHDKFGKVAMLFWRKKLTYAEFKRECQKFLLPHQIPKYIRPLPSRERGEIKLSSSSLIKSAKKKTAVIFLHGFMGDLSDWDEIINILPHQYGFHYQSWNLPLHGCNTQGLEHFFHKLNGENPDPFFLVGYSMGGRIALEFATKFPQKIKGLFLESINPGIEDKVEKDLRFKTDQKLFSNKTKEEFFSFWFSLDLFNGMKEHPQFQRLLEKRLKGDMKKWQRALGELSIGNRPNLWGPLSDLSFPIHYRAGLDDKKYVKIADEIKQLNHSIAISIDPSSSHNTHFQNPQSFALELEDFLIKANSQKFIGSASL